MVGCFSCGATGQPELHSVMMSDAKSICHDRTVPQVTRVMSHFSQVSASTMFFVPRLAVLLSPPPPRDRVTRRLAKVGWFLGPTASELQLGKSLWRAKQPICLQVCVFYRLLMLDPASGLVASLSLHLSLCLSLYLSVCLSVCPSASLLRGRDKQEMRGDRYCG